MATLRDLNFHAKSVTDIKWNQDGQYIASSSNDKTVKIGQFESSGSARVIHTVPCSTVMTQIAWHPLESNRFSIAGEDKGIEIWDVRASRSSGKIFSLGSNLFTTWSPDGRYLAVGNKSDNIAVFDVTAGRQVQKVKFGYEINELAWSANSDHLIVATAGGDMGCVDVLSFSETELTLQESVAAHTSNCLCLKIDSSFQRMAVGSTDFCVSMWDLDDLVCHHTVLLESPIRGISFSGDGRLVAASPETPTLVVYNFETGEQVFKQDFAHYLNAIAWNPRHHLIAIAPEDKSHAHPQYLRLLSIPPAVTA